MKVDSKVAYIEDKLKKYKDIDFEANISLIEGKEIYFDFNKISLNRDFVKEEISLSALKEGKKGNANRTSLGEDVIDGLIEEAIDSMELSEKDEFVEVSQSSSKDFQDQGPEEAEVDKMVKRIEEFVDSVRSTYKNIRLDAIGIVHNKEERVYYNTKNTKLTSKRNYYSFNCMFAGVKDGETTSFNYYGFPLTSIDKPIMDQLMMNYLISNTEKQFNPIMADKFKGDLIIAPSAMGEILYYFKGIIGDSAILTKSSPWLDKLGERVAREGVNIKLRKNGPDMVQGDFITSEGYEAKDVSIIEDGILKKLLASRYVARKTGLDPVDNQSVNIEIGPGSSSLEEMIKSTKKGVLLNRLSAGAPSASGDLAGLCKNSFLIEDGEIKSPLKETMVSINIAKMWENISEISQEREFASMILPFIKIENVDIYSK